jgi:hypothetical protein
MKKRKFAAGGAATPAVGPAAQTAQSVAMTPPFAPGGSLPGNPGGIGSSAYSGLSQINQGASQVGNALQGATMSLGQAANAIGGGGGSSGGIGGGGNVDIEALKQSYLNQKNAPKSPGMTMKKGGKVKGYAKGGSVASASKRGDGIAQRGKTRGRMV